MFDQNKNWLRLINPKAYELLNTAETQARTAGHVLAGETTQGPTPFLYEGEVCIAAHSGCAVFLFVTGENAGSLAPISYIQEVERFDPPEDDEKKEELLSAIRRALNIKPR